VKITPHTGNRYSPRPVALVRPGLNVVEVWTDWGRETHHGSGATEALINLEGHRVYCTGGVTAVRLINDSRSWTVTVWKGRASSIALDGTRVVIGNLRGVLDTATDPWGDLQTFLAWIGTRGVNPASVGTMSTNLWRSTLEHPIVFDSRPDVTRPAFFGGRQEARPKTYRHMAHYDLRSAYPHSMAAEPFALGLRRSKVAPDFETLEPAILRASVLIPPHFAYGPLPAHAEAPMQDVILYDKEGILEGSWSARELRVAREMGCHVRVMEAWMPTRTIQPFTPWWILMGEGRRLPGEAAMLAKTMANTLWGSFAMEGSLTQWKWSTKHGSDRPHIVGGDPKNRKDLPHSRARHIAVETTARVRTRLLREGLLASPVPPVHVDTDGIIIRGSAPCPEPAGEELGQWRVKWRAPVCEIAGPQTYRRTCGHGCNITHPKWHYTSAGRTEAEARQHWRTEVRICMDFGNGPVPLNTVLERRLSAARIAQSQLDMAARDQRFPDLSTEEQERFLCHQ
jgi:hypothetical protein